MIVAYAHGIGHVGMFLVTLWVRLVFGRYAVLLPLARRPVDVQRLLFRITEQAVGRVACHTLDKKPISLKAINKKHPPGRAAAGFE